MFRVIPLSLCKKSLLRFTVTAKANAHSAAPATSGHSEVAEQFNRIDVYPRIGSREIVGFGRNGEPTYFDSPDCPCPAVRWSEDSAEIKQLREKAKGDWSNLTLAEKKTLYRADFRSTISETMAPDGEWKFIIGSVLAFLGGTIWLYYFFSKNIYNYPRLDTSSVEHQTRMLERMLAEGQGRVEGIASKWDYEKGDWKKILKTKFD